MNERYRNNLLTVVDHVVIIPWEVLTKSKEGLEGIPQKQGQAWQSKQSVLM